MFIQIKALANEGKLVSCMETLINQGIARYVITIPKEELARGFSYFTCVFVYTVSETSSRYVSLFRIL